MRLIFGIYSPSLGFLDACNLPGQGSATSLCKDQGPVRQDKGTPR